MSNDHFALFQGQRPERRGGRLGIERPRPGCLRIGPEPVRMPHRRPRLHDADVSAATPALIAPLRTTRKNHAPGCSGNGTLGDQLEKRFLDYVFRRIAPLLAHRARVQRAYRSTNPPSQSESMRGRPGDLPGVKPFIYYDNSRPHSSQKNLLEIMILSRAQSAIGYSHRTSKLAMPPRGRWSCAPQSSLAPLARSDTMSGLGTFPYCS